MSQLVLMFLSAVVGGLEFLPQIPDYVYRYASFLFSFLGRGACKFYVSESRCGYQLL